MINKEEFRQQAILTFLQGNLNSNCIAYKGIEMSHYRACMLLAIDQADELIKELESREPKSVPISQIDFNEPQFKVDDWVVYRSTPLRVCDIKNKYILTDGRNVIEVPIHSQNIKEWTIADAKNGDVLIANEDSEYKWYGIFKEHTGETFTSHCHYNHGTAEFVIAPGRCRNHGSGKWGTIHPANEAQRHTLFAEMKRAGYEWDDEKKRVYKL